MGFVLASLLMTAAVASPAPADGALILHPSSRTGLADLFLTDPATGNAKNLTRTEQAEEIYPAWSPDGKSIAFSCKTREHNFEIYVCDADGANRKMVSTPPAGPSISLIPSWSADGKQVVYSRISPANKYEIRVASVDGSSDEAVQANAFGPAWSPDGKTIAFVRKEPGKPHQLAVMNPDGTGAKVLVEDLGQVDFIFPAWSPDSRLIAYSADTTHGVQLFLIPRTGGTPRQLTHLLGYNLNPVWLSRDRLLFSHFAPQAAGQINVANGGYAAIKVDGSRLEIHPLTKLDPPHPMSRPAVFLARVEARPVKAAEPGPVRPAAYAEPAAEKRSIQVSPVTVVPPVAPGAAGAVAWSPDGRQLAVGLEAGAVCIGEFNGKSVRPVENFRGHVGPVEGVAFAANGKVVYSVGGDQSVRTWDVAQKGSKLIETDHTSSVDALAVSADGKLLATGDRDGKLRVRDAATGKPVTEVTVGDPRRGSVHAVAFGKDAVFAGCARWDVPILHGVVAAYNPNTGKQLWRTKGSLGGVFALAVSPTGTKVAGACLDSYVRVWDAETGKELACWKGHTDRVTGVAWGQNGKVVVSCGFDHTVRVWDAATGTLVQTLAAHATPVTRVAASPDGKHVVSGGQSGTLIVWKVTER